MCKYVDVWALMYMVWVYVCMCRLEDELGYWSLPSNLRQGLFVVHCRDARLAGLPAPRDSLVSTSHFTIGIIGTHYCARLYLGPGDSNSSPHTCTERALSSEPSLRLPHADFPV